MRRTMAAQGISILGDTNGLVIRLVSRRDFKFPSLPAMRERYSNYPEHFPYESKVLFAFQEVDGRDICIFAMYVQEYGPDSPPPNTNRTYISYLDTVRYLRTDPPEQRTPVYHALINGYLHHARESGFENAHIWVAPPQAGDEYIFHCHPADPRYGKKPMKPEKLRQWYVRMLSTAKAQGIIDEFTDLHDHVVHLTTIRDFPLFEGDFFPDHLRESLVARPTGPSSGPPGLTKQSSTFLVNDMKKKTKSMRKRFLVAKLNVGGASGGGDR